MKSLINIAASLLILGLVFYAVEKWSPSIPGQAIRRKGFGVDVMYWFFTPFITKGLTRIAMLAAVVLVAWLMGRHIGPETGPEVVRGFGPIVEQPSWLIALEMVVLGDFIGYWTHRTFHGPQLWKFHAIHHSSVQLDWLSSVRVHPVNDVLNRLPQVLILMLIGFPLTALAAYVPFLTLYAIMLHANVGWSFGPLRKLLASPVFHRWHHTSEAEGLNKNFAGLFPLWDILFGTYYHPRDKIPQRFGLERTQVPADLIGQLAFPFRRS